MGKLILRTVLRRTAAWRTSAGGVGSGRPGPLIARTLKAADRGVRVTDNAGGGTALDDVDGTDLVGGIVVSARGCPGW